MPQDAPDSYNTFWRANAHVTLQNPIAQVFKEIICHVDPDTNFYVEEFGTFVETSDETGKAIFAERWDSLKEHYDLVQLGPMHKDACHLFMGQAKFIPKDFVVVQLKTDETTPVWYNKRQIRGDAAVVDDGAVMKTIHQQFLDGLQTTTYFGNVIAAHVEDMVIGMEERGIYLRQDRDKNVAVLLENNQSLFDSFREQVEVWIHDFTQNYPPKS